MIDITRAEAIDGWMRPEELRWLAEHARRSQVIVEGGCWQGRSTRVLADHCPGVVYAVDPWSGPYLTHTGQVHRIVTEQYDVFRANLADHMAAGRVIAVREPSQTAFLRLASQLGPVADLVFIDGDHRYEAVCEDILAAHKLVRPGGIVAGHDFGHSSWPGVKQAVEEFYGTEFSRGPKSIWWARA